MVHNGGFGRLIGAKDEAYIDIWVLICSDDRAYVVCKVAIEWKKEAVNNNHQFIVYIIIARTCTTKNNIKIENTNFSFIFYTKC